MADYKYTTTLQPISVYGYRFATATVTEAPTESAAATAVTFGRDVHILARLDGATVTTNNADKIPTSVNNVDTKVGDKFYFLVQ